MEGNRAVTGGTPAARHFREEDGGTTSLSDRDIGEIRIQTGLPLEVHMTDEPGSDPYNHTGRFRRSFR